MCPVCSMLQHPSLQDTICCNNLSLTLVKMGEILSETCWADFVDH